MPPGQMVAELTVIVGVGLTTTETVVVFEQVVTVLVAVTVKVNTP